MHLWAEERQRITPAVEILLLFAIWPILHESTDLLPMVRRNRRYIEFSATLVSALRPGGWYCQLPAVVHFLHRERPPYNLIS